MDVDVCYKHFLEMILASCMHYTQESENNFLLIQLSLFSNYTSHNL